MVNEIADLDQTAFRAWRAANHKEVIQFTWIYDRPIDLDALGRFQHNLGYGLLGRRIERSPLPFARDRWVVARAPRTLDTSQTARARADVGAWADERARMPIDPERGPSWHLGVLPLKDGGAAITLVASHTVADAIGMSLAVADASEGRTHELGYPPRASRTHAKALLQDARQTLASVPEITRALIAAVKLTRRSRREATSSTATALPPPPAVAGCDQTAAAVPILMTAYIDLTDWDATAKRLGGTSNSLFAGIAARLGTGLGRVLEDGTALLFCPVNVRTEGDRRGNALAYALFAVDPTHAASDLSTVRAKTKLALTQLAATPDSFSTLLPLAPVTPNVIASRLTRLFPGNAYQAIGCSNVGELDAAVNRPDGTDASNLSIRLIWQAIKNSTIEGCGGKLFLLSGRVHGKLFITITAYFIGPQDNVNKLHEAASRTFAEFGLTAKFE